MSGFSVRREDGTYKVLDPSGCVAARYAHRDRAEAKADALTRAPHDRAKERPCMCCRRVFRSEGIHNRLCTECRRQTADHDAWGPSPGKARFGRRS